MSPNGIHLSNQEVEARRLLDNLEKIRDPDMEKTSKRTFKRELVWQNVLVFVVGHLLGLYGGYLWLFYTPWIPFWVGFILSWVVAVNGVLMGSHRYYTHRCFKASKTMQVGMLIAQTVASQNCLWVWVRDHRQHHKYTDTDADPHNAKNGFFFSHVGWLLSKKHPEVIEKGKGIDMSDLDADPLVMFQKRHYKTLWVTFVVLLPIMVSVCVLGQPWLNTFLSWVVFRTIATLNVTWLVNSWAHLYGTKPFEKSIMPVESYFVSFCTLGEGWHNYHHIFPWDYKASEFGTLNYVSSYIRLLARLGLVWDLREASEDMVVARARRTGDGTPIRTKLSHEHVLTDDWDESSVFQD